MLDINIVYQHTRIPWMLLIPLLTTKFWVFFASVHGFQRTPSKFLFSSLAAAICSPLGTLIMANERFQAQSLIYLHTPREHNVFLLFLYHWTPFCVHIHLKHNTHSGGIKNDSGITAVPLFTRPSA